MDNPAEVGSLITSIIGVASIVAAMTPNKTDNAVLQHILGIINLFGFNVGKARNRDE